MAYNERLVLKSVLLDSAECHISAWNFPWQFIGPIRIFRTLKKGKIEDVRSFAALVYVLGSVSVSLFQMNAPVGILFPSIRIMEIASWLQSTDIIS